MKHKQVSSAKIFLVNEKNQALMLRIGLYLRHPEKSHTPDLPGGLIDTGESELDAVIRELREETGIVIDQKLVRLGYASTEFFAPSHKSLNKLVYVARLDHTPEVKVSWEHEAYEWADIELFADTYTMRPFYDEAIRYIVRHKLV